MKGIVCTILILAGITASAQSGFSLREVKDKKKVEIFYNKKLVTAYCFFDSTEKPVLFPIKTLSGNTITRGFPISPRVGERVDHPHHVGLWLNYESVNGLDFWNNSSAIPAEKKPLYGSIRHQEVLSASSQKGVANLKTRSTWVDHENNVLLDEVTEFVFKELKGAMVIDRTSTLKAVTPQVSFKDVKDGFLGLRVARELEMPSKQEDKFIDANGNVTTVPMAKNDGVTGMYVNREGITGDDTWAKRSRWNCLNGTKDGEQISIAIIDHPLNIGFPTYWHSRGYGLFAANPLGQKVFSQGKEELNYKLSAGEYATFRYRIVIKSSNAHLTASEIDAFMEDFVRK